MPRAKRKIKTFHEYNPPRYDKMIIFLAAIASFWILVFLLYLYVTIEIWIMIFNLMKLCFAIGVFLFVFWWNDRQREKNIMAGIKVAETFLSSQRTEFNNILRTSANAYQANARVAVERTKADSRIEQQRNSHMLHEQRRENEIQRKLIERKAKEDEDEQRKNKQRENERKEEEVMRKFYNSSKIDFSDIEEEI